MPGTGGLLAAPADDELQPDRSADAGAGPADGRRALIGVVALAALVRLAWVANQRHAPLKGDPYYYHHLANLLADGQGFVEPLTFLVSGQSVPDAAHPPLFVLYLSLWSLVGADSVLWHQFAAALLGTASVFVLALAGRRLGGPRAGVLVGFLAALSPNFWVWDGILASETMAITTVALFVLAVVRYLEQPSARCLVAVGATAGLAALSRAEFVLLALAVVPLVLRTAGVATAVRVRWAAAALVVAGAVIAPWAAYNQTRFSEPVALSTGLGLVLVSSTCDAAWYGQLTGYWSFGCSVAGVTATGAAVTAGGQGGTAAVDTSVTDARLRRVASRYVREHPSRLPAVVGARLGRVTGLYRPVQQAQLQVSSEGAPGFVAGSTLTTWYLFAGLAIYGGRRLRRAGVPLVALCLPMAIVLLTSALTYGIGRFRSPGETVVVLLAGVGTDLLVRRRWEQRPEPAEPSLLATYATRD